MRQFVKDGYELHRGVMDMRLVKFCREFVVHRVPNRDLHDASRGIMDALAKTDEFSRLMRGPLEVMQGLLGPDVCMLGYDALWINAPKDKDPVLSKGIHNDAWSGTSINTVFAKVFLTDCDRYNGVTMYAGSHLQGMLPVRNRKLAVKVKFPARNIIAQAGELLIWHPLTLHSTTGHSGKNTRISITSRYTSTETPFSSQERSLGYRPLSVGPMNQILRLIGSDSLTPMRTYGGSVSIDKRLNDLYA